MTGRPHFDLVDAMVEDADQAPVLARLLEAAQAQQEAQAARDRASGAR